MGKGEDSMKTKRAPKARPPLVEEVFDLCGGDGFTVAQLLGASAKKPRARLPR